MAGDLTLLALRRQARRLLAPWDRPDSPGASLGLVREDRLDLHESAGMASLELGVPIDAATCFRIASVSKQFTCAAILLLEEDGLLSTEDEVQRHLPELPDLGAPIRLDHLMRNSSGLRDMLELMRMGGADLAQPCPASALLEAVLRQRSLNFAPGSRFLYSNTNFMLLGLVAERVAGTPLGALLEQRILAPLGMTRTRHTPSVAEIVPGLATGYLPREGGFGRAGHAFPLGGEGGLVSCVEDLAIWDRALATGRVIGRHLAEGLPAQAHFANGLVNAYARGLELATHRGIRTQDHGGLWPGFRTCFLRAPEQGLAVIAIANHGGIDTHLMAQRMLDAAIEGRPGVHAVPALPPGEALAPLLGRWIEPATATTLELTLDEAGEPVATQRGVPFALVPTPEGRLAARRGAFPFIVTPPAAGMATLLVEGSAGIVVEYHRAPAGPALPAGLAGRYRCEEAGADWLIDAEADGALAVRVHGPVVSAGPWAIAPMAEDALRIATPGTLFQGWLDARVLRDAAGGIAALEVSGARALALRFERIG